MSKTTDKIKTIHTAFRIPSDILNSLDNFSAEYYDGNRSRAANEILKNFFYKRELEKSKSIFKTKTTLRPKTQKTLF